jgi:hypothetical protein
MGVFLFTAALTVGIIGAAIYGGMCLYTHNDLNFAYAA